MINLIELQWSVLHLLGYKVEQEGYGGRYKYKIRNPDGTIISEHTGGIVPLDDSDVAQMAIDVGNIPDFARDLNAAIRLLPEPLDLRLYRELSGDWFAIFVDNTGPEAEWEGDHQSSPAAAICDAYLEWRLNP